MLLEGNVGIIVFLLVEVTVGYSSHFHDALVTNLAARLGIDLCPCHLGIGTISGSEDRELRVGRVLGTEIPAETRQGGLIEHTERLTVLIFYVVERRVVDFHDSLTCMLLCCSVGIGTHIAGTVTTAINVVVLLEAS